MKEETEEVKNMSIKNPRNSLEQRRTLRRSMTDAETLFWERVRNKQILDTRFKRQYGIGPYILDFYVPKANLCIEIDGGIHNLEEVKRKDLNRDAFLERNCIHVLRFKNSEIENDIDRVVESVKLKIQTSL